MLPKNELCSFDLKEAFQRWFSPQTHLQKYKHGKYLIYYLSFTSLLQKVTWKTDKTLI